jgi:tRNA 2-thiouridine synthesizing protein A
MLGADWRAGVSKCESGEGMRDERAVVSRHRVALISARRADAATAPRSRPGIQHPNYERRMTNEDCLNEKRVADHHIDAMGLLCPEPLMIVRNKVRSMRDGEVLHVRATDPSTSRDFSNFCRFLGHELVSSDQSDDGDVTVYQYLIRKGG